MRYCRDLCPGLCDGRRAEGGGRREVERGAVDGGRWTMGGGRREVGDGRRAAGRERDEAAQTHQVTERPPNDNIRASRWPI